MRLPAVWGAHAKWRQDMSTKVTVEHKVTIDGVGSYSTQHNATVEAIDALTIHLEASTGSPVTANVEVQPGSQVWCLLIKTQTYGDDITFDVAGGGSHALDGPVALSGAGPIELLQNAPTSIAFSSMRTEPVDIEIVACRDAVV